MRAIVAGLDRFLPTAPLEVIVDNVAPPRSRPAGTKVLEGACLDHLVVELAECLGELVLGYAGLCAHRLEVGGGGAHTLFFPSAPPRPASQLLKRFICSRNPHRPNSQTNQAVICRTAGPLIWLDSDSRSLTRQGFLTCQSSGNPQVQRRQSEDGVRWLPFWRQRTKSAHSAKALTSPLAVRTEAYARLCSSGSFEISTARSNSLRSTSQSTKTGDLRNRVPEATQRQPASISRLWTSPR